MRFRIHCRVFVTFAIVCICTLYVVFKKDCSRSKVRSEISPVPSVLSDGNFFASVIYLNTRVVKYWLTTIASVTVCTKSV